MKNIRSVVQLTALGTAIVALAFTNGCSKESGLQKSGTVVSAEKTSFKEVTAHLDAGGDFYLYLSTEQWLKDLSGKVAAWRQLIAGLPEMKDEDRANVDKGFNVLTDLIKQSGIEDVSGLGMSSIAREPGLYYSKAILHHYKGKDSGFLWNMMGHKPHALNGLDLMPANTVFATFADLDVPLLWSVIQREVKQSGFPKAEQALKELPQNFEKATGVKWEKLLSSLGGEFGFAITFNEANQIPIPLPTDEPLQVPEPALMIVMKVNDDTVFDRVDKALKDSGQQPMAVNEGGLKMRTLPIPLPLPIQLRPTLATSDGYLILATGDALVRSALAVKSGKEPGLKSTAEFKRLAAGVPTEGNQFVFLSRRFGQTLVNVQRQALAMSKDAPPGAKDFMRSLLNPDQAAFTYSVGAHTDEGWLTVGNGNQGAGQVLAAGAIVAPVGLLSAIAIPNFVKARQTAQNNACINNLRMIDGAKHQWALENKKAATSTPVEKDLLIYLKGGQIPNCPVGGSYEINSLNESPECSMPGHKLPE